MSSTIYAFIQWIESQHVIGVSAAKVIAWVTSHLWQVVSYLEVHTFEQTLSYINQLIQRL